MSKKIVCPKKFDGILRNHLASARVKYDKDWDNAFMFGGKLPTRPNMKVIEATLKLEFEIKG